MESPADTEPTPEAAREIAELHAPVLHFGNRESIQRDAGFGLSERTVRTLSKSKSEPDWLLAHRLKYLGLFERVERTVPWAAPALAKLPFDDLCYYSPPLSTVRGQKQPVDSVVEDVLQEIGIREEEKTVLGGAQAQIDGAVVYGGLRDEWAKAGVIFVDSARGLTEYADLFRPHFGTVVGADINPFTRLNNAMFSGGSFIYVPPGVKVTAPMKCFMHLQTRCGTQFGRTLIVADKGSEVIFMEGCTSTPRKEPGLHCAVGEFVALPGSRIQYIAMQDWSRNIFNLAILRAHVYEGASMQWIDCNLGGRLTMKYPAAVLKGRGASAEMVSIAVAGAGQHHDTGARMLHQAPQTSSSIRTKSVSFGGGRADYRSLVDMPRTVRDCRSHTECSALLMDAASRADTYPTLCTHGRTNIAQHEASVSRVGAEQIFYMRQRGLSEAAARSMSINGFVNDLTERFPLQYSLRIKKLVELHLDGSVG
ncbi:MAG: Fe-S cluster assembly protein SufB [Verrucomicrobiota bacterium]